MTLRPTLPSLTAVVALLILQAPNMFAQEATTAETTTKAPAKVAPVDDAVATDLTATDSASADQAAAAGEMTASGMPAGSPRDGSAPGAVATGEAATPSPEMQAVLDKLAELGSDPIGTLAPEAQREEPSPADAVMAVMEERDIALPANLAAIATRDITYPGADGSALPARVYTPEGEGPFPLIVYYHGGGWVIADLDTYDASARGLAEGTGAVVLSVEYRKGPENPFPAFHEDADAAYVWAIENSGELNADSGRLAVAGESAGGNLAINVAITARDLKLTQPDHMLLVYPLINNDLITPSYEAYGDDPPLTRLAIDWFVEHAFTDPSQTADPRVNVLDRTDLAGLPPTTIVNAEIDVLQSEGELLAEALRTQGVEVAQSTYPGVTHEFFGMVAMVPQAGEAMDMATDALRKAFGTR